MDHSSEVPLHSPHKLVEIFFDCIIGYNFKFLQICSYNYKYAYIQLSVMSAMSAVRIEEGIFRKVRGI